MEKETTQRHTVKAHGFPLDVTKDHLKSYFKQVARCAANPTVAIEKPGSAIVVFESEEVADLVTRAEHKIDGVPFHVGPMPPPFLDQAEVRLSAQWTETVTEREDVRLILEKEHGISSSFVKGGWIFKSNFYKIQSLHRVLDDLLPVLPSPDIAEEFEMIEGLGESSMNGLDKKSEETVSDSNLNMPSVPSFENFSEITDSDLYAEDKVKSVGEVPEAEPVINPLPPINVAIDSAASSSLATSSEPQTPSTADVEDTEIVLVDQEKTKDIRNRIERSQKEKSLENHGQPAAVTARVSLPGSSIPSAPPMELEPRGPPSLLDYAFLIVSVGLYQYIKVHRKADLEQICDTYHVNVKKSSSGQDRSTVKVNISPRDASRSSMVQEAQRRLEILFREINVRVQQAAFTIDETIAGSAEITTLVSDIAEAFPEITICRKQTDLLFVGDTDQVKQAGEMFNQGHQSVAENCQPGRLRSTDTPPEGVTRSSVQNEDDERSQLLQQLLDKGDATPSVMNDILGARSLAPPSNARQLNSDLTFPRVDDDVVCVAESSSPFGAPVVSQNGEEQHVQPTCSFCGEADESSLTKLRNCDHYLCAQCIEPAKTQGVCVVCEEPIILGSLPVGTQPSGGRMLEEALPDKLPGFESTSQGTIVIVYNVPNGIQTQHHANPGRPFVGRTNVRCYLPDTTEGRHVLRMMRVAFKQRLLFTVVNDRVEFAEGISHKTETRSASYIENGYPDNGYLGKVTAELASFGITMEYVREQCSGGHGSI